MTMEGDIAQATDGLLPIDTGYDLSGLVEYTMEGQYAFGASKGITSFPAVAHYYNEVGEECLRYIMAKHTPGPVPTAEQKGAPVFELIKAAFAEYKPDFVIAEGFDGSGETWYNANYSCDNPDYVNQENPGEAMYTVRMAKEHGVTFMGGEPTDEFLLGEIQKKGYSKDDMAMLYIIRQVAEGFRNKEFTLEDELPDLVEKASTQYSKLFERTYSYADCQDWLEANCGHRFSFKEFIDTELTAPKTVGNKLQQIDYEISILRDKNILTTILDGKKSYKKILTVYGGSHYYVEHNVLDKYFGEPKFSK